MGHTTEQCGCTKAGSGGNDNNSDDTTPATPATPAKDDDYVPTPKNADEAKEQFFSFIEDGDVGAAIAYFFSNLFVFFG